VHPTYEYWGANWKFSKEEMVVRVSQLFSGVIRKKTYPEAYSLVRPADPVSFRPHHIV
jgi:hypothetical protein